MRLTLLCVGRLRAGPERSLCERYAKRVADLSRGLSMAGPDIVELPESRQRRPEDRRRDEARALNDRLADGLLIALDERGEALDTPGFAGKLAHARASQRPALQFVIGGPDGLEGSVRDRAGLVLGFGRLTLPHQLVRVLVLEQIYRAMTLMGGHPYHRE